MSLSLVIRTDATPGIGAGHAMRTSVLAEAWRRSVGPAIVWGTVTLPFVRDRLAQCAVPVVAEPPAGADALVVDSYDEVLRSSLARSRRFGSRLLVDDGGGQVPTGFDLLWHPSPHGTAELYPQTTARVLTGPRYVPLRPDLPRWERVASRSRQRVAVLLGGGAAAGALVPALLRAAALRPDRRFVAAGEWAPPGWERIDGLDVWAQAVRCDCVVTAAGTSLFEAAAVGVPVVALQIVDNQAANLEWARSAGAPVLDVVTAEDPGRWLAAAIDGACVLPPLQNGASAVLRELEAVARSAGAEL